MDYVTISTCRIVIEHLLTKNICRDSNILDNKMSRFPYSQPKEKKSLYSLL